MKLVQSLSLSRSHKTSYPVTGSLAYYPVKDKLQRKHRWKTLLRQLSRDVCDIDVIWAEYTGWWLVNDGFFFF